MIRFWSGLPTGPPARPKVSRDFWRRSVARVPRSGDRGTTRDFGLSRVGPVPASRACDRRLIGRKEPALRLLSDCVIVLSFETIEFSAKWKQ